MRPHRIAAWSLWLLSCATPCFAVDETELPQLTVQQITPFWQQQVIKGTLKAKDGLPLAYAYVAPPQAKATILLVQGRTEAYLKYQEVMFDWVNQGYAVFTLDHRGQGLSGRMLPDPEKGHVDHFSQYAEDQAAFLTEIVRPNQRGPLLLYAHSMGGAVAVQLLASQPDSFQAAVLSSPMMAPNATVLFGERDGCGLSTLLGWTCTDCYAGFADQPYNDQAFSENILTRSEIRYQQFRAVFRQTPQARLGGPTWQWLAEACDVASEMPSLATQLKTPVLMLQAGDEQAVSNDAQQQFCQQLGGLCTELHAYPGALHELLFERDAIRNDVFQRVDAFYTAHLKLAF